MLGPASAFRNRDRMQSLLHFACRLGWNWCASIDVGSQPVTICSDTLVTDQLGAVPCCLWDKAMSDDGSTKPSKRRKTARACDYCRDHKLKCDFSTDKPGTSSLKCKHCKDFGIECNISARILPQRAAGGPSALPITKVCRGDNPLCFRIVSLTPFSKQNNGDQKFQRMRAVAQTEPRYAGPTSLSQLVSAVTRRWPTRANQMMSQMDMRFGHARVEGVSGGPFLMLPQARYPADQPDTPELERAKIDSATKRFLLGKYQRVQARVFPILSDKESTEAVELGQEDQPIATLSNVGLALLSIAAMIRDTPVQIRTALLYHLRRRRHVDVSSSLETIQYLLLLCANVEILSSDTNISTGMSLNLTGKQHRRPPTYGRVDVYHIH